MNIDLAKYFNKIDNDNMFKINNNVYFLIPNNSHSMFLIYSQIYNSKINKNNHIQQMKFNLLNKINILENIRSEQRDIEPPEQIGIESLEFEIPTIRDSELERMADDPSIYLDTLYSNIRMYSIINERKDHIQFNVHENYFIAPFKSITMEIQITKENIYNIIKEKNLDGPHILYLKYILIYVKTDYELISNILYNLELENSTLTKSTDDKSKSRVLKIEGKSIDAHMSRFMKSIGVLQEAIEYTNISKDIYNTVLTKLKQEDGVRIVPSVEYEPNKYEFLNIKDLICVKYYNIFIPYNNEQLSKIFKLKDKINKINKMLTITTSGEHINNIITYIQPFEYWVFVFSYVHVYKYAVEKIEDLNKINEYIIQHNIVHHVMSNEKHIDVTVMNILKCYDNVNSIINSCSIDYLQYYQLFVK